MSETMQSLFDTVTTKEHIRLSEASDERLAIAGIDPRTLEAWGGQMNRYWGNFAGNIKNSPLWWISDEMTDLISFAAPDFPSHRLQADDFDDLCGIVLFSHPIKSKRVLDDVESSFCVSGMSWTPSEIVDQSTGKKALGLSITTWSRIADDHVFSRRGMSWYPISATYWLLGKTPNELYGDPTESNWALEDCSRLMTMRMLATQTGIAETTERRLTRHERKRSERSGATISPIKIVNVRGLRSAGGHGEAEGNVEWSHRWMVGGHWRNQPFGPERAQRRPVWVAPYVKGPADKPLVVKETIKVLK